MKLIFCLGILLLGVNAQAYLTSDFDVATGYTGATLKTTGNTVNMNSMSTLDFSYNLNNPAWSSALNLVFSEVATSSQGNLAWTRVGVGVRYYPIGYNGERVIFDNQVEGRYWRPAPFVGFSTGFSNFSVESVDGTSGYFNATSMDFNLRFGAEVVLTSNYFLTGQISALMGVPNENPKTKKDFSYTAMGIYMGLKILSF